MKALIAVVLFAACGKTAQKLEFVEVKRDDLVIGVAITGELEAVDSTDIKPPTVESDSFKIAMLAPEGAELKANDPIIAFDTSEMAREVESRQNEIDAAQKQLEKKRDDAALARREEDLAIANAEAALRKAKLKIERPDELVASLDRKLAELEEKAAEIDVEQAKNTAQQKRRQDADEVAALNEKRAYAQKRSDELAKSMEKMAMTAPRAGTVVYPTGWRGEKKKVGDGAWRGEVILQVVGLGKMRAVGEVDEVDMARLADKQSVSIQLDALADVQVKGTIEQIAKSLAAKSNADPSKVVQVKVALDPTTAPLRPGMRFRGEIEAERIKQVVLVPVEGVFVTPEGPIAYRETSAGGVEKVKLTVGKYSASFVQVTAGLAPGDRVSRMEPK